MMNNRFLWLGAACVAMTIATPLSADSTSDTEIVRSFTVHIEVAGADESDRASDKEIKASGTNMVPAQPSASSRNPLAPERASDAAPKIPEPAAQAVEPESKTADTGEEDKASDGSSESKPSNAADSIQKVSDQPTLPKEQPDTSESLLYQTYARIDAGYSLTGDPDGSGRNGTFTQTDIQNTGFFDIGAGMTVDKQVRLEGVFTYRSGLDIDGTDGGNAAVAGELENLSAMINVIYDVEEAHEYLGSDLITPYVGAGIGIAMLDTDSMTTAGGPTEQGTEVYNLAYSVMAGLGIKMTEALTVDIGYRFVNLGQFEQDGSFSTGITAAATKFDDLLVHEFKGGLRFRF